jgi:hypothetical protein
MKSCIQKTFLCFFSFLFLSMLAKAQTIERVTFNERNANTDFYLALQPNSHHIQGVLVLIPSFKEPPTDFFAYTRLFNTGYMNDLLVVSINTDEKAYLDSAMRTRMNNAFKDIQVRYRVDPSHFVLGGVQDGGNIALRYTELAQLEPSACVIRPQAVFALDPTLNIEHQYQHLQEIIRKNEAPPQVGFARYLSEVMEKDLGSDFTSKGKYQIYSAYPEGDVTAIASLMLLPVKIFAKTQGSGEGNSTKSKDQLQFIEAIQQKGNHKAELIEPTNSANTSLWNLLDESQLIDWVKKELHFFPQYAIPFYQLTAPADWVAERKLFPLDFAPQLSYRGIDDIRFPKGWGKAGSEMMWSYLFFWLLDDNPQFDAATLQRDLTFYYDGIVKGMAAFQKRDSTKLMPTTVKIVAQDKQGNDEQTFQGQLSLFDPFVTFQPIDLHMLIHVTRLAGRKVVVFEVSPKAYADPIWQQLDRVAKTLRPMDRTE